LEGIQEMTEWDGIEFPDAEEIKEIKVEYKDPKNEQYYRNLDKDRNELFGCGNGNDDGQANMQHEKVSKKDIDFVIDTMVKEAQHDGISIKQLFFGMASTFTKIPMPHNVNSKNAGAGKSYLLNLVADYFPHKHVMVLSGASDKVFQHRDGIMVIKNEETGILEEVAPRIEKLEVELEILEEKETEQNKQRIKEIKKEIKYLQKNQQKLIDLDNTIILILDTPQDALLVNIMSLASQDSEKNQEYIYNDKSSSGKIVQRSNIIKGMPVLFSTRVIDDTKHVRFEETNRRSINVTPNVSVEKIESAIDLIVKRYSLLPEEYDEQVVSRQDKEKAKKIVSCLVEKLKNHSKYFGSKQSGIKIPFDRAIIRSIPGNDVWSMTVADRTIRYLSIITKMNMDSRPRFVDAQTGAFYPISTFDDLKEVLEVMERGASNIRTYIAEWYNMVFKPAYDELPQEPDSRIIEKAGKEMTVTEERRGITTNALIEKTSQVLKIPKPSSDQILKKYLYPLLNHGIIDKNESQINKNNNLYFPADEEQNIFSLFSNNDSRLEIKGNAFYPSKTAMEQVLMSFTNRTIEENHHAEDSSYKNNFYRIVDPDMPFISVTKQILCILSCKLY